MGKMGANMARRLMSNDIRCVVYDRLPDNAAALSEEGALAVQSLAELAAALSPPRAIWVMVPDTVVDEVQSELMEYLQPGDVVVDGGNSFFGDAQRRAAAMAGQGVEWMDAGTSGGIWGLERGYCLMVGGSKPAFRRLEPVFRALAPGQEVAPPTAGRPQRATSAESGYLYCGGSGAGHFVKMVHNAIEYGLMAAYAEGFALLEKAASAEDGPVQLEADTDEVAELWRRGSVIGSWLLDLAAGALGKDPALAAFTGGVADSGEGRWALKTATDMAIPVPVLAAALFDRYQSRGEGDYSHRLLTALRSAFGGHAGSAD